jgi:hypothetical protein
VSDELEQERKLRHEMTLKQETTQQSETVLRRTVTELESQILSLDASKVRNEVSHRNFTIFVSKMLTYQFVAQLIGGGAISVFF